MANDVTLPGTGVVVRSYLVGAASCEQVQVVRLDLGTSSTEFLLSTGNPIPIFAASGFLSVCSTNLDAALSTRALESGGNLATINTNTAPGVVSNAGIYIRQDSTATVAKETGGNLATVKTNTDPLVTAGGGGYVRQDSTATIAKETGGNIATINTNTAPFVNTSCGGVIRQDNTASIAKETGGNLATIAGAVASSKVNIAEIASTGYFYSALTTAAQIVSTAPTNLRAYYVYNPNATVTFVQMFDTTATSTAGITLGTTVPKWSVGIPATSAANLAGLRLGFLKAFQVAATTAATGATGPSSGLTANFAIE